jgi:hypothetical protein
MGSYSTRKSTVQGKAETLHRRNVRQGKYLAVPIPERF